MTHVSRMMVVLLLACRGDALPSASPAPAVAVASASTTPITRAELVPALAKVEHDARARGVVTDADFRRGTATIEAAGLDPARTAVEMRVFGERLLLLRKQLELRPITDELAALLTEIGSKPEARRALIAKYRAAARPLPTRERLDALERLKRFDTGVVR
jgi:hypothetical protein